MIEYDLSNHARDMIEDIGGGKMRLKVDQENNAIYLRLDENAIKV